MRILFHLLVVSFVFSYLFACSSEGGENDKISEIELEKQKVELEREKLRLEKEKQELEQDRIEQEREQQIKKEQIMKLEQMFPSHTYANVIVNKSYFHSQPESKFKSNRKFLVSGDQVEVLRTINGFGYVEFHNYEYDKTTSGWIDLNDLTPYEPGC